MLKNKVSIVFIGTSNYTKFFKNWYSSIKNNFLNECDKTIFAFTDKIEDKIFSKPDVVTIKVPHKPWPYPTLMRFSFIKKIFDHKSFKESDFFLYLDADLIVQKNISLKDIFGNFDKDLVGVHHPGNFLDPSWNAFVTKGLSSSNVFLNTNETINTLKTKKYHQGCLWGGKKNKIIEMVNECNNSVLDDFDKSVIADWHDESHMNCYFLKNYHNLRTLSSEFAFPAHPNFYNKMLNIGLTPNIIHIDKSHEEYPRFKGGTI